MGGWDCSRLGVDKRAARYSAAMVRLHMVAHVTFWESTRLVRFGRRQAEGETPHRHHLGRILVCQTDCRHFCSASCLGEGGTKPVYSHRPLPQPTMSHKQPCGTTAGSMCLWHRPSGRPYGNCIHLPPPGAFCCSVDASVKIEGAIRGCGRDTKGKSRAAEAERERTGAPD